jgi:hypothetical protein|tara:strand:+ start:2598 stop:3401 length:804 start_codon:yes stop_codon:yes gene_type:complete
MSGYLVKNLTNYVKGVMSKNTSAVFLFDGRSGLGKTTLSSQVGCFINQECKKYMDKVRVFCLDDMAWTPDIFIEKLKKAKKGDVIILDESMILSNRSTMSEINRMIIIMMSMIRSKQIFVIFNVNSIFDLDKNLPLHRADMLCHLYAEDDKFASRGRYGVVPSAKGKLKDLYINGKKYYDYSKARYAFRDKFTPFFPFSEKEYEKRKQKDIADYFSQKKTTSSQYKISRDLGICYLKKEYGLSPEEIGEIFKIGRATVFRVLKETST